MSESSRVEADFRQLIDRMRHRLYPETVPVLASYWLKTVYWGGYARDQWRELDRLLKRSLAGDLGLGGSCLASLADIHGWIKERGKADKPPASDPRASLVRRPALSQEVLVPYTVRLLNEWVPMEVARMLVGASGEEDADSSGIPVLAVGKALEHMLLRERLSVTTLEALLNPELVSSRLAYPADQEVLRDVILFVLGRTAGITPAVLPAVLLSAVQEVSGDFPAAIDSAYLVKSADGEEVHVPIRPARVKQILTGWPVGIGSILVSQDGRWWEEGSVHGGDEDVIAYRPKGRLRIDYSADHARLRVPWPDARHWSGSVHLPQRIELFGRRWSVVEWEKDRTHAWLNLVFSAAMPVTVLPSADGARLRRCSPAAADLAWSELERALASAVAQKQWDPVEHLHREDLVPLGRALFALTQSVLDRRERKLESLQSHLQRVRFVQAGLDSSYGPIPWRVLPAPVRKTLEGKRLYPKLLELLEPAFAGMPEPALASLTRSAGQ